MSTHRMKLNHTNLGPHSSNVQESSFLKNQQGYTRSIWEDNIKREEHAMVFCSLMVQTIDSCVNKRYENLDAQTTSNCCHGLSILAKRLIISSKLIEMEIIRSGLIGAMISLKNGGEIRDFTEFISNIPGVLLDLISLRALTYIIDVDPFVGRKTVPARLKNLAKVSGKFCITLIKNLQRKISNIVAESYSHYLTQMPNYRWINGTQIQSWGMYSTLPYLRVDKRGIKYAPCLFSMQISIAYLSHTNSVIALVNDLIDGETKQTQDRYVALITKDKDGRLLPISNPENTRQIKEEPIVVFGGYSIDRKKNLSPSASLQPWIYQFPSLILACDIHYPQFPNVSDDINFNSEPISIKDYLIHETIEKHKEVKGVSADDSSLFCLSHIFLANYTQIQKVATKIDMSALPSCFLPCEALTKTLESSCKD